MTFVFDDLLILDEIMKRKAPAMSRGFCRLQQLLLRHSAQRPLAFRHTHTLEKWRTDPYGHQRSLPGKRDGQRHGATPKRGIFISQTLLHRTPNCFPTKLVAAVARLRTSLNSFFT